MTAQATQSAAAEQAIDPGAEAALTQAQAADIRGQQARAILENSQANAAATAASGAESAQSAATAQAAAAGADLPESTAPTTTADDDAPSSAERGATSARPVTSERTAAKALERLLSGAQRATDAAPVVEQNASAATAPTREARPIDTTNAPSLATNAGVTATSVASDGASAGDAGANGENGQPSNGGAQQSNTSATASARRSDASRADRSTDGPHRASAQADHAATGAAPGGASGSPAAAGALGATGASATLGATTGGSSAHAPSLRRPEGTADDSALASTVSRGLAAAVSQKGGSITMRLEPESLGALRIHLDISGGVVRATFEATTAHAADALARSVDSLRAGLESKGLSVESIRVEQAPGAASPASAGQQSGGSQTSADQRHGAGAQRDDAQRNFNHDAGDGRSRGYDDRRQNGSGEERQAREGEQGSAQPAAPVFERWLRLGLDTRA